MPMGDAGPQGEETEKNRQKKEANKYGYTNGFISTTIFTTIIITEGCWHTPIVVPPEN